MSGHEIVEAAQGGLAGPGASFHPINRYAHHRAANDRQIKSGGAIADPAAIFSGGDIQAQMQAGFDAPILAIGLKHLLGTHLGCPTGAEEVFGFDALRRMAPAIEAASESGGLLHKGEVGCRGCEVERNQAARFSAAPIELTGLGERPFGQRGENRARSFDRAVARFGRSRADCL